MIKERARLAVVWSSLDLLIRMAVGFGISIVLARLLVPEDFGAVALLAIFIGVAGVFVNGGLGQALIQRKDVTHLDESTVFWFNIVASIVAMLILTVASPWIANFFGLPVLIPLTIVLAVNIVIGAIGSIHYTLMSKQLDFKTPMKIGVCSTLISGTVAIYMAWSGYGLWALVAQIIAGSSISVGLLWLLSPWRPLLRFSKHSFKKLFGFGGWIFVSALLDTLYQRGYTLLIGKFYSTHDLGIFNRADSTQQLPVSILTGVLERVSFPIMSATNHDYGRLQQGVRLSIRSMMLITTPVMLGLMAVSESFVLTVFGEQWSPSVPILQVLCLAGMLMPLHVVNLSALQAQGHSKLFFRLEIAKKSTGMGLLLAGCFFGVIGIAWSRVVQSAIALVINSYYTKKFLDYGIFSQIKDVLPTILMSTLMAVVVSLLPRVMEVNDGLLLIISILVGGMLYLLMNVVGGGVAFREALALLRSKA